MDRERIWIADEELEDDQRYPSVSPGKSTLSSRLANVMPLQLVRDQISSSRGAPVMRKAAAPDWSSVAAPDPREGFASSLGVDLDALRVQAKGALEGPSVQETAAQGVSGSAGPLPHLEQIQRSFGHHDLREVHAHVGGPARRASDALSAEAYAFGQDVAFRQQPDLHTAAHEAAHVVQQRGGVSLKGGVGEVGDEYERHADAVADRVTRGESAERLLDRVSGGGAPGRAVQRLDSHDIVGNTLSATGDTRSVDPDHPPTTTSDGTLDERSQRRTYERIAQLRGEAPAEAGRRWEAMRPEERQTALHEAVSWFQRRNASQIEQIRADNEVLDENGEPLYSPPRHGRKSRYTAPRADVTEGEVRLNDATMQALANAWPQTIFGRQMYEAQAYEVLKRMVLGRGMPFDTSAVNVVGVRAYQGGAIHDNGEPQGRVSTAQNRYDDTTFILFGDHQVQQSRATVDPGGEARVEFQVAADQQWDYRGNPRGRTRKYDRAMYSLDDPMDVRRGRYWQQHPEEVEAAAREGGGGRLVRHNGRTRLDRNAANEPRMVSAVHSGGVGRRSGEQTGGDSTGCTVVHGAWFANFNETLRRASGGNQVRFTYSLIDPRTYTGSELNLILDSVVPQPRTEPRAEPTRRSPYVFIPQERPTVHPDGDIDPALDPTSVHRAAQAGVAHGGGPLPHRDAIQRSFGHHDVSGVRAHVGGPAAEAADAIGARAYATGDDVAFASSPDLRQAAHEAAHTVQQRGGVRLDGGVGRAGDPYEQHADAVADRVVRGESAEALLDTMAHRGSAGGLAVQREAESREQLRQALAAVDEASDLVAAERALAQLHPRLPAERDREFVVPIDGTDHRVRGRDVRFLRNRVRTRKSALHAMGSIGTGEWDRNSAPQRGQTLTTPSGRTHIIEAQGRKRVVRIGGLTLLLRHRSGWGIMYGDGGSLSRLHAASERVAQRMEAEGHPYRAAAARGMTVLGEGGIASINTYDGMTFTLGTGYTGGRLSRVLSHLDGTPAGAALRQIPYFASGRFNGSRDIILDVDAHARIVSVVRQHEDAFADAMVLEWIDGSAMPRRRGAAGEEAGDALAPRVMPELIGVASYLSHGLPRYAPNPIGDATRAADAHPNSPSRQLAVVLKLYAQRVAERPPGAKRLATIIDARIPNKVSHFIRAARARDPGFAFNLAEAQAEIPCLRLEAPWPHVTSQPGGVSIHLERNGGEWWDFGPPI